MPFGTKICMSTSYLHSFPIAECAMADFLCTTVSDMVGETKARTTGSSYPPAPWRTNRYALASISVVVVVVVIVLVIVAVVVVVVAVERSHQKKMASIKNRIEGNIKVVMIGKPFLFLRGMESK